jgi:hypothetical protein
MVGQDISTLFLPKKSLLSCSGAVVELDPYPDPSRLFVEREKMGSVHYREIGFLSQGKKGAKGNPW